MNPDALKSRISSFMRIEAKKCSQERTGRLKNERVSRLETPKWCRNANKR